MRRLIDILATRIRTSGPMPISDYMAECLFHPRWGYYSRPNPIGLSGSFTTAPEISQMFGELLGLCIARSWLEHGQPKRFTLAELGPGRGTLMADFLRAASGIPGFVTSADIVLVERSIPLCQEQRRMLTASGRNIQWIEDISQLPQQPLFLVANEFFDALPIRQFRRSGTCWQEVLVGLRKKKLAFGLSSPVPNPGVAIRDRGVPDTAFYELRPTADRIVQVISSRIAAHGGAAIIIDYGSEVLSGTTFQAVCGHEKVHPLLDPGQCDLSAYVNFGSIKSACECRFAGPIAQGAFLSRLGIRERHLHLAQGMNAKQLISHDQACMRLIHPDKMGNLFKVMALYHDHQPPGFH